MTAGTGSTGSEGHLASLLVALFPGAWRARYGDEFRALLAESPRSSRAWLDILSGALDAHLHPQIPGERDGGRGVTERRSIEVVGEFHVARTRHDVYEFLVDTDHFRQVDPALVAFEPGGRMTEGIRGTMRHRRAGLPARTTWHVAQLVPDERLLVEVRGVGYALTEDVRLSDATGGTTMRVIDRLSGTSALGDLFVLASRGSIRRDLDARGRRLLAALATT